MEEAKVLKMRESAVSKEVAENEFERFAEMMDLDVDTSKMDAEELQKFSGMRDLVVLEITRGNLDIDDKGQPTYRPKSGGDPITFYEPTGASFITMDGKKTGHDISKMYAVIAEMTHTHEKLFAKMPQRDLKVCQAISTLFLG